MRVCNFVGLLALTIAVAFGSTANAQYSQDFEGVADGATDLGDGTTIADNQGGSVAMVIDTGSPDFGNALRLAQDGIGSLRSSFRIPAPAGSSAGWSASFDFMLSDDTGNPPADGFNFSYGAIPAYDPGASETSPAGHGAAEESWPGVNHLAFEIDTWMNGDTEVGYNIAVEGVSPDPAFLNTNVFEDNTTVIGRAEMSWDGAGNASMSIDYGAGNVLNADFVNADVSAFTADESYIFAFGTRTGGANETLLIDNLTITAVPEPSTIVLALMSVVAIGFGIRRRS